MEQKMEETNLWWAWALAFVGALTVLLMVFAVTSASQADAAIAGNGQVSDHMTQDMETWHQSTDHLNMEAASHHAGGDHEDCVTDQPHSPGDMATTRMGDMPTAGMGMGMSGG
ncbi:MAG: hypothetical protein IH818_14160 [Acidobacteria bacterium]|nr:hypothetical protein [Acidobacteriota bacterium]